MRFVDTNIFLRHILNDLPDQSPMCLALFQAIERGDLTVWTTDLAIAEVVCVLGGRKTYALRRTEIRDALLPLLAFPHLRIARKRIYTRVFELYVTLPISFVDAFHIALVESQPNKEIHSFDADFDRVNTVRRLRP